MCYIQTSIIFKYFKVNTRDKWMLKRKVHICMIILTCSNFFVYRTFCLYGAWRSCSVSSLSNLWVWWFRVHSSTKCTWSCSTSLCIIFIKACTTCVYYNIPRVTWWLSTSTTTWISLVINVCVYIDMRKIKSDKKFSHEATN